MFLLENAARFAKKTFKDVNNSFIEFSTFVNEIWPNDLHTHIHAHKPKPQQILVFIKQNLGLSSTIMIIYNAWKNISLRWEQNTI